MKNQRERKKKERHKNKNIKKYGLATNKEKKNVFNILYTKIKIKHVNLSLQEEKHFIVNLSLAFLQ